MCLAMCWELYYPPIMALALHATSCLRHLKKKTEDRVTQEDGEACLCLRRPRLTCDLTFTHSLLFAYILFALLL